MAEKELDFAPSPLLAALSGLGKGISDEVKRRKEAEAKRIQSESALFRQLFPVFFQEQGRQRRFEKEQTTGMQQWGLEQLFERDKFAAEREEARREYDLKLKNIDVTLADMKTRREQWKQEFEFGHEKFDYQKEQDAIANSLALLSETHKLMIAQLGSLTTLAEGGTFADKTTAALNLEKIRQEFDMNFEALKDKLLRGREEVRAGIETVEQWQRSYNDFMTNNRIMQSYLLAKAEGDRDTMETIAPRVGGILNSFYQRWLKLPEATRPPIESLEQMQEFKEEHGWIFKRERPAFELVPREQTTSPEEVEHPGMQVERPPIQVTDILKKYDLSDNFNYLGYIKSLHGGEKLKVWEPYRKWLEKQGVLASDINKIWRRLD